MLKPVSRFVSFILGTKFIRFFGTRIITSSKAFMPAGSLMFVKSNDESMPYMANEIYNQHVYDTVFEISEGQTVVDVGANVGMFTVRAAKKVGNHGRIISIEPSQTNYDLLARNIKMQPVGMSQRSILPLEVKSMSASLTSTTGTGIAHLSNVTMRKSKRERSLK